jgi:CheY-like chemotaxis protein
MQRKLKTILLVDDDPITNFINERLLTKMKLADEVKTVINGEEGVKCLHDHCFKTKISPELILLDINMPIMNGFEFLEAYKFIEFINKEEIVIAVLTTSENSEDKRRMAELGIKCFVNKPLTEQKINDFLMGCSSGN